MENKNPIYKFNKLITIGNDLLKLQEDINNIILSENVFIISNIGSSKIGKLTVLLVIF